MSQDYRGGGRGAGRGRGGRGRHDTAAAAADRQPELVEAEFKKAVELMDKRTRIINTSSCVLPDKSEFFNSKPWDIDELAANRDQLNDAKSMLDTWDSKAWDKAAVQANRAALISRQYLRSDLRVEMATVAWAKMYETIVCCDMLPPNSPAVPTKDRGKPGMVTVHLCEAPGAFIAATNHFIQTRRQDWSWDWMAVSLNPWYEGNDSHAMNDDDALIAVTKAHWCFGADNSGDIRKQPNIREIWRRARELSEAKHCAGAAMVTADGAVDTAVNPNKQELINASLHFCEVVTALGVLAPGGTFVWKGFTVYEYPSICSLYLMGCIFDEVLVYKPATSKPANSEVYVVGRGFKGIPEDVLELLLQECGEDVFDDRAMFKLSLLPDSFLASACEAAMFFGNVTADAIKEATELFGLRNAGVLAAMRAAQQRFAQHWVDRLQVLPLPPERRLAPGKDLNGASNNTSNQMERRRALSGTLQERQQYYADRRAALDMDAGHLRDEPGAPPGSASRSASSRSRSSSAEPEMYVSSKALEMMAKMGHKPGQGLGAHSQGITSPVAAAGNMRRAGLGAGGAGAAVAEWSPQPDATLLLNGAPLQEEEVQEWGPVGRVGVPQRITKSKILFRDEALIALRTARLAYAAAAATSGYCGPCLHNIPCVAPRTRGHAGRPFWKLAALDAALGVCAVAAGAAARADAAVPRALDLSLCNAGATEYLLTREADGWNVTLLDTPQAEEFADRGAHAEVVRLQCLAAKLPAYVADAVLAAERGSPQASMELFTRESSCRLAASVPGVWLVLGDLGSLERLQPPDAPFALGPLEGEFAPLYRRRLLWEAATALGALAPGGCLVLRLGDVMTMFSASLLYLLHRSFERLALVKPFASCSCAAERFVACMGFMDVAGVAKRRVLQALDEVAALERPSPQENDMVVGELVPASVCVESGAFYQYVGSRTIAMAERQTRHCNAAVEAAEDAAAAADASPGGGGLGLGLGARAAEVRVTDEEYARIAERAERALRGDPTMTLPRAQQDEGDDGPAVNPGSSITPSPDQAGNSHRERPPNHANEDTGTAGLGERQANGSEPPPSAVTTTSHSQPGRSANGPPAKRARLPPAPHAVLPQPPACAPSGRDSSPLPSPPPLRHTRPPPAPHDGSAPLPQGTSGQRWQAPAAVEEDGWEYHEIDQDLVPEPRPPPPEDFWEGPVAESLMRLPGPPRATPIYWWEECCTLEANGGVPPWVGPPGPPAMLQLPPPPQAGHPGPPGHHHHHGGGGGAPPPHAHQPQRQQEGHYGGAGGASGGPVLEVDLWVHSHKGQEKVARFRSRDPIPPPALPLLHGAQALVVPPSGPPEHGYVYKDEVKPSFPPPTHQAVRMVLLPVPGEEAKVKSFMMHAMLSKTAPGRDKVAVPEVNGNRLTRGKLYLSLRDAAATEPQHGLLLWCNTS